MACFPVVPGNIYQFVSLNVLETTLDLVHSSLVKLKLEKKKGSVA